MMDHKRDVLKGQVFTLLLGFNKIVDGGSILAMRFHYL
jgi:hypothetical protein